VCETPRSVSFCAHAILEPSGRFVVADAALDLRFSGNPLVIDGPRLRSYAGHVLHDPYGNAIGALAVADREPRQFSEEQLAVLADLAAIAEREIEAVDREVTLRAVQRLERSKHALLETFAEGLVLHAVTGEIVEWNSAAERVLGLSGDELAGRTSIDPRWRCVREDGTDWPGDTHPAMVALATGQPVHDRLMGVHRPQGDLVWLRVNAQPIVDGGVLSGVFAAFQDITAEITFERRSRAMADRLTAAIEAGGVGTALLDGEGRITFGNAAIASILDVDRRQLTGAQLSSWFEVADPVHVQFDEVRTGIRQSISADVCLKPSDPADTSRSAPGMPATTDARWIRLNLSHLPDVDDAGAMLAQVTDITLRRHLEADLARSEELARVCLDVLEQGVIFASPTLGFLRVNPSALRLLGYGPDEALPEWDSTDWVLLGPDARPVTDEDYPITRAVETGVAVRDEVYWARRKDGDFIRVRLTCIPFGWTDELVCVFTDITPYTRPGDPRPERVFIDESLLQGVTPRS
jgi:PAS domain S-box-containing protein